MEQKRSKEEEYRVFCENILKAPEMNYYEAQKYLKKHTFYNAIDEITILFLFNKYSVSYISEPIKLSNDKSTKLYTLTYKFILI